MYYRYHSIANDLSKLKCCTLKLFGEEVDFKDREAYTCLFRVQ